MPLLTLCAPEDPRLLEAASAVEALDVEIRAGQRALEDNAAALDTLLAHPCLALAQSEMKPTFETAESLAIWWDSGGARWLRSYLDPADRGLVVLPPDPRPTPTLACPPQTPDCGAAARGWTMEANIAMTRHSDREASRAGISLDACAAEPGRDAYARWWSCVDRASRRTGVLPLRAATPPDEGTLVVRGTRGVCEILQVYSLPSGDAVLIRSCPATPEAPAELDRRAGQVDTARLSELVWFLFVGPDVGDAQRSEAVILTLPPGLERSRDPDAPVLTASAQSWSTNQSALAWGFNGPNDELSRSGELTWPWSADASEDYTDRLLLGVERSFTAGCPAPIPTELLGGRLPGEPPAERPGGHPLSPSEGLGAALGSLPPCEP